MRAPRAALALGVAAGALAGCDPILSMDGVVRTAPDPCSLPGAGKSEGAPVPGASVIMRCRVGGDAEVLRATTDADGRFHEATAGFGDPSCSVVVDKPGFVRRELPLRCVDEEGVPHPAGSGPCLFRGYVELDKAR